MTDPLRPIADRIADQSGVAGLEIAIVLGELTIDVAPDRLLALATFLRDDPLCQFHMLIDLCGVDYPAQADRFLVAYNFLSLTRNARCRVRTRVGEEGEVPSLVSLYPAAAWFEREAYDLYGIFFSGNADLRRLLTDYGFEGHPFRKDFPLTGYVEVRYDEREKRVLYEKVSLTQAFRSFDFVSPWEGMLDHRLLPGDEKAQS